MIFKQHFQFWYENVSSGKNYIINGDNGKEEESKEYEEFTENEGWIDDQSQFIFEHDVAIYSIAKSQTNRRQGQSFGRQSVFGQRHASGRARNDQS